MFKLITSLIFVQIGLVFELLQLVVDGRVFLCVLSIFWWSIRQERVNHNITTFTTVIFNHNITTFTTTPQINKETWYVLIVYCLFYKRSALMSSLLVIWKRVEWYTDTNQQGQKFAVEPGMYLNTIHFIWWTKNQNLIGTRRIVFVLTNTRWEDTMCTL